MLAPKVKVSLKKKSKKTSKTGKNKNEKKEDKENKDDKNEKKETTTHSYDPSSVTYHPILNACWRQGEKFVKSNEKNIKRVKFL